MNPSISGTRHSAAGITLVEVLLAILLISVGSLGLASFQGVFTRDSGSAKARSVAAELAREKLDDLKSYTTLDTGAAGFFGYLEIANNAGGAECTTAAIAETNNLCNGKAVGALRIPSGTVVVGNTSYNRTWTSTNYFYCSTNAAPATSCTPAKARPDFKALRVSLAWTDADGQAQTLNIDGVVGAIDPATSAASLITGASVSPPSVPYRAGLAPDVIAINLGGNQSKETTNPTPTLNKKGQAIINTIARYETIRFSSDSNTITREQFTTLNCSCKQNGTGTAKNLAGVTVTKRVGIPANSDQAAECAVCCRDHHDSSASCDPTTDTGRKGCYDPYRPSSDYTSGDHNHYNANGQLANNSGDTYVEACRIKRVDGDLRVAQDWNLVSLALIPENFFASNDVANTTNIAAYGTYVKDLIKAELASSTPPSKPWEVATTVALNGTRPYSARGIYLDYLSDSEKSSYVTRINGSDTKVFQEIPFYEVNMTKLAQWTTDNAATVTVRNDQLVSELPGQDLYTRGLATGKSIGVTNIRVSASAGNTGVINEFVTTDPNDGSQRKADAHEVTVPGSNPTLSGSVSPTISSGLFITASNGGSCTVALSTFTCTVPFNWTGTITAAASGFVFSPAQFAYTNLTAATTTGLAFTASASTQTYSITGLLSPPVADAIVGASSGGSCSYSSTDGRYTCTVPNNWTGTITPSSGTHNFAPFSRTHSNVLANLVGQDFASTLKSNSFVISGNILPILASVSFSTTAGASCSYTPTTGAYSCSVPSGFTGTISPLASGFSFSPGSLSLSSVSSNSTGNDFAALANTYAISGLIAPHTSGTVVTASNGGSCLYASGSPNGTYSCTVPELWSGSVTPTATGKTFSPATRNYSNVTSSFSTENYTVADITSTTISLSGTITNIGNKASDFATIEITAGGSCTTPVRVVPSCDKNCAFSYSCSVTISGGGSWSGTLTPGSSNNGSKTFSPATANYTNINTNRTQDFACTGGGC